MSALHPPVAVPHAPEHSPPVAPHVSPHYSSEASPHDGGLMTATMPRKGGREGAIETVRD